MTLVVGIFLFYMYSSRKKGVSLYQQKEINMFKIITKANSVVISAMGCTILVEQKGTKVSGLDKIDQKDHTFVKRIETFFNAFTSDYKKAFDAISGICKDIDDSKSFRAFSNNLRRACNKYVVANGMTSNAQFQAQFFYEGTMEGRTTHGANAPWLGDSVNAIIAPTTKTKKIVQTQENDNTFVGAVEAKTPYKPFNFDMNNPWDKINKGIADRIAETQEK